MSKEIIKEYTKDDVTILWKPKKCIHSAVCVGGLPEVFKPEEKPWINMEGAKVERIVEQVRKCPSGALSLKTKESKPNEELKSIPKVAGLTPMTVTLEEGKTYAWCACGLSANQPWCDGSHKVTSITPKIFKVEEYSKVSLCMCKQSANKPFCDDSHLIL